MSGHQQFAAKVCTVLQLLTIRTNSKISGFFRLGTQRTALLQILQHQALMGQGRGDLQAVSCLFPLLRTQWQVLTGQ